MGVAVGVYYLCSPPLTRRRCLRSSPVCRPRYSSGHFDAADPGVGQLGGGGGRKGGGREGKREGEREGGRERRSGREKGREGMREGRGGSKGEEGR